MTPADKTFDLLVVVAPPIACGVVGHLTGSAFFYFLAFPACFVGPWLGARFASKPKQKPKTPPSKGWFVDKS